VLPFPPEFPCWCWVLHTCFSLVVTINSLKFGGTFLFGQTLPCSILKHILNPMDTAGVSYTTKVLCYILQTSYVIYYKKETDVVGTPPNIPMLSPMFPPTVELGVEDPSLSQPSNFSNFDFLVRARPGPKFGLCVGHIRNRCRRHFGNPRACSSVV
jgi:hypothetical protein